MAGEAPTPPAPPAPAPEPTPAPPAPAPFVPPGDWPPMPPGMTPDQERDWLLRMWHTEAVRDQTRALREAIDSNKALFTQNLEVIALLSKSEDAALKAVKEVLALVFPCK